MGKDIKAEAARVAKQLNTIHRRCRLCVIARHDPEGHAIFAELIKTTPLVRAGRWLFDRAGAEYSPNALRAHKDHMGEIA